MNPKDVEDWFNIYYSQNMEDLIIKAFLSNLKDGFYVDVGAHDPEYFSVTKLFYDSGWRGINIEPQLKYYRRLNKARKRDINLNVAISNIPGKAQITEYPDADGLSTLSPRMAESYTNDKTYGDVTKTKREYEVITQSLSSIFKEYCAEVEVNFLKIDVEGFEEEVLLSNDWKLYRPWLVCIEANHKLKKWEKILVRANYNLVFSDGLNEYYLAEERKALLESFDYAKTVLYKVPLSAVPLKLFCQEIRALYRNQRQQELVLKKQDEHIKLQNAQINALKNKIAFLESKKLKNRIKSLSNKTSNLRKGSSNT